MNAARFAVGILIAASLAAIAAGTAMYAIAHAEEVDAQHRRGRS